MEQKKAPEKDFRKQSSQYFLIGLVVSLSITLLAFEWGTYEHKTIDLPDVSIIDEIEDELDKIVIVSRKLPPPPPPKPTPPVIEPTPQKQVVIVIAPPVITNDTAITTPDLPDEVPVIEYIPKPTRYPEKFPEFVGGEAALYKYLGENLKYPPLALDHGLEARIYVQFVVNLDGSISDVEVLKKGGYGFDAAAEKVIKEMPKWNPGSKAGKKVRVIYVIPINFALK